MKELTKPNNQLLLTDKAANFCEKYFVKSDTKQKNITEQLEVLAAPSPKTITKGNRTFNFLNRTTLIFSGTAEELKFITEEPAFSSNASIIRLPDKLGDKWFEPDLYDHLESYRSEVIQFLYYYNGHEDDSASISNLSINSEENNDALINPLNSFERFFNRYVIITGEDKDYTSKQLLFDKYKNYCYSI